VWRGGAGVVSMLAISESSTFQEWEGVGDRPVQLISDLISWISIEVCMDDDDSP